MSLTVGKLAKKYGLSRSTLLYYNSIGLLTPTGHTKGEYRRYSEEDEKRLEQICIYRQAGIALKGIIKMLDSPATSFTTILKQRFEDLNQEIKDLHHQQYIIAGLLENTEILKQSEVMTKELWSSLLEQAGFSEQDMRLWHTNFEQMDPEKHVIFLQHLQIPEDEIRIIRQWAAEPQKIRKVQEMSDTFMMIFMELFESVQRQGPGSRESTCRALSYCRNLPDNPNILDVGCGSGAQSVVLAQETGGTVTAVDTHQPFLEIAKKNAEKVKLPGSISFLNQDMNDLDFQAESFDLIWSEGAIYLMGFDNGLRTWKPLLRKGGILAVSELSWFTDDRSDEAVAFWQEGYPQLRPVEENLEAIQKAGFELLGNFNLPESDWTEVFYKELEEQLVEIEHKYPDVPEAEAVVNSNRKEIELFNKASESFGYSFYILRAL